VFGLEHITPKPTLPPGCVDYRNDIGGRVLRIHYTADPFKNKAWAAEERSKYSTKEAWAQEQEIDNQAYSGARVFPNFDVDVNWCEPFPIPHDWTRYMGIDPHGRRPHAFLWMAVSPDDDHWYYREYWPSNVYGVKGRLPEDDDIYTIDSYVQILDFLEGPEPNVFSVGGYADNQGKKEEFYERVMDPHAKGIFTERHKGRDEPETFWHRYENLGIHCKEAKRDFRAGRDKVNDRLLPKKYDNGDGTVSWRPIIHVFNTLIELRLELRENRYARLTPTQAEKRDPHADPMEKRKHMTDLVRYLEIEDPQYIPRDRVVESLPPLAPGISY
jgi:hypothetical protein